MVNYASSTDIPREYRQSLGFREDQQIDYILSSLTQKSYAYLLFNQNKLKAAQKIISHVHPFSFLEHSFKSTSLRGKLITLVNNGGVIWNQCYKDLALTIKEEMDKGNVAPHIDSFVTHIKGDFEVKHPDNLSECANELKTKKDLESIKSFLSEVIVHIKA